jgi:hypothetical protein
MQTDRVEEAVVRGALAQFTGVWDELIPRERARVLRLLIDEVRFDGAGGPAALAGARGETHVLWLNGMLGGMVVARIVAAFACVSISSAQTVWSMGGPRCRSCRGRTRRHRVAERAVVPALRP